MDILDERRRLLVRKATHILTDQEPQEPRLLSPEEEEKWAKSKSTNFQSNFREKGGRGGYSFRGKGGFRGGRGGGFGPGQLHPGCRPGGFDGQGKGKGKGWNKKQSYDKKSSYKPSEAMES